MGTYFSSNLWKLNPTTHLTVRARVDLIVVAARKKFFFHNFPKVVVGHGLKDYGVKNLFTM